VLRFENPAEVGLKLVKSKKTMEQDLNLNQTGDVLVLEITTELLFISPSLMNYSVDVRCQECQIL